jgi:hypothetical protein
MMRSLAFRWALSLECDWRIAKLVSTPSPPEQILHSGRREVSCHRPRCLSCNVAAVGGDFSGTDGSLSDIGGDFAGHNALCLNRGSNIRCNLGHTTNWSTDADDPS